MSKKAQVFLGRRIPDKKWKTIAKNIA